MEKRGVVSGEGSEVGGSAQQRTAKDALKAAQDVAKPCCGGSCGTDPLSRLAEKTAETSKKDAK